LHNVFREVDGDIDVTARFKWRDSVFSSDGDAIIAVRKLVTNEYTVTNAATNITLDSLVPLSTPPEQVVEIGILDIGVPITDGRVVLELKKDGAVRAGLEKFNLFGGRIETRPFTLPQDYNNFTIPLAVTGVQLDELLNIAKFGDLTATGALDGLLPLTIADGEVAVLGGVLETTKPGTIQYRPKEVGDAISDVNEGAALLLDIVKDFKYNKIQVTLDETEFEEIALGFGIEGYNEAVYGGLPVKLNVNLSGPLRKILQRGYETFTTPAWLRDRIRNIEQKSPNG
ncbi:MAG: intermembrane phospholipid transport protein YdbH family protein, partial [Alphaproteobacteria bacterium]